MRKIMFRFWDGERKIMHHKVTLLGLHWESDDNPPVYIGNSTFDYGKGRTVPHYSNGAVMQFTGLHDNDGKGIYEGDIVKTVALLNDHSQKGAINTTIVKQHMGNFCLCFDGCETGTPVYPFIVSHEIEVIGNIYENPELLGVNDNAQTP